MNKILVSLILLFSLTNFAQSSFVKKGGVLSYCEETFPRSFDPYSSPDDMPNVRLTSMMFQSLFEFDIEKNIIPDLVATYEILPSSREIKISLKKKIKWSDGGELTARDVEATILTLAKSDIHKSYVNNILSVTPTSSYDIQITFNRSYNERDLLSLLTFKILPWYKLENGLPDIQSDYAKNPVVSGPFQFISRLPGGIGIKLAANEKYRLADLEGRPYLNEVHVYEVPDVAQQIEYLENDQVEVLVEIPPTSITRLEAKAFQIKRYASLAFNAFAFNFNNKLLANDKIRLAMNYGFNRANVIQSVYQGQGELISCPFLPGSIFIPNNLAPRDYNTTKAIDLLTQAGFGMVDGDGVRYNAQGEKLQFEVLLKYEDDDFLPRVLSQFIEDMQRIGIKITQQELYKNEFLNRLKCVKDFDMAYIELVFNNISDVSPLFGSNFIDKNNCSTNFTSYSNPFIDRLFLQYRETINIDEKININRMIANILYEDSPYLFCWTLNKNAAANNSIGNFRTKVTPFGFFDLIEEWYKR